jgi:hypothetical protein
MSDNIKCIFDECSFSGFCKRHTFAVKTFDDPHFAMRPPVNEEYKCTAFVPISGLAEKIYNLSKTPLTSGVEVIFDSPKHLNR